MNKIGDDETRETSAKHTAWQQNDESPIDTQE